MRVIYQAGKWPEIMVGGPPPRFQISHCLRPFYSWLHHVKLVILWISEASTQYLTAEMIYIE